MFGVAEMFGGVGHAELPFEEGDGVADFVDVLVSGGDGRFGDQTGHLAVGQFAENAGFAEAGAVAAGGGVGVGKDAVVEDVDLLQAGEDVVDIGGEEGAGGELLLEFADGEGATAEEAGGVVPESVVIQFLRNTRSHALIVATRGASGNSNRRSTQGSSTLCDVH